ncbi:MAG TPA: TIGR03435 family protein [Acidobacteriaceae bacterium]|nr:TIGR03435 family protein [Acidobacteriaceae bacterium]
MSRHSLPKFFPARVRAAVLLAMICAALPTRTSYGQSDAGAPSASASTQTIQWDVVSVKMHAPEARDSRMQLLPNGVRLLNLPVQDLFVQAYGLVLSDQIVGIPNWANSQRFDIEAKVADKDVEAFRKLTLDQICAMGRPILTGRFKFAAHEEKKILPLYALVVAKDGPKLTPSTLSEDDRNAQTGMIGMGHVPSASGTGSSMNELTARGVTMERLAAVLSQQGLGRVVLDDTGLTGRYDFKLAWAPEAATTDSTDTPAPSIFTAVSEQLGLKLEPQKGPVSVLAISHIEMPSPD